MSRTDGHPLLDVTGVTVRPDWDLRQEEPPGVGACFPGSKLEHGSYFTRVYPG